MSLTKLTRALRPAKGNSDPAVPAAKLSRASVFSSVYILATGFVLGGLAGALKTDHRAPPFNIEQSGELADLFVALRHAPTPEHATLLEQHIWEAWQGNASPKLTDLMSQAAFAQSLDDEDAAFVAYSQALHINPNYIPAYDQRAALYYEHDQLLAALRDIERALIIDRRHFGAWVGLGSIFEDMEKYAAAEQAYLQALRYHPHLKEAKDGLLRIHRKLHGDIS